MWAAVAVLGLISYGLAPQFAPTCGVVVECAGVSRGLPCYPNASELRCVEAAAKPVAAYCLDAFATADSRTAISAWYAAELAPKPGLCAPTPLA